MAKKIGRNDPCPCGSGKKYKFCCGSNNNDLHYHERSDMKLQDFAIERIREDVMTIEDALQIIIGPYGYDYCKTHADEISEEYEKDHLRSFVQQDKMNVFGTCSREDRIDRFSKVRPYGGDIPENNLDIMSLFKDGFICVEGLQVYVFHAYLMENLRRRFNDYFYIPTKEANEGQEADPFYHRGYDFLLGMTLFLELQLGIHVYFDVVYPSLDETFFKTIKPWFGLENVETKLTTGMKILLCEYSMIITEIAVKYSGEKEIEIYHDLGVYSSEEEYEELKKAINPKTYLPEYDYNYIQHLFYLVSAVCFNQGGYFAFAVTSFPQCDFIKYLMGIENICKLFEEKIENTEVDPKERYDVEKLEKWANENKIEINVNEKIVFTRKNTYHDTVFQMFDEKNGMTWGVRPGSFEYIDFAEINDDDYTMIEGLRRINPARKETRHNAHRKLRMELYQVLNGHCFTLYMGEFPGDIQARKIVGKYPIIPWISSGKEHTVHSKPCEYQSVPFEKLYSWDMNERQEFLNIEYRLTSIPVNCIEEFLNPEIFYTWDERRNLLEETRKQNIALEEANTNLNKQIETNHNLVRNIAHQAANYLN